MDDKVVKNQAQLTQAQPLVHSFSSDSIKNAFTPKVYSLLLVVVVAGLVSGYFLSSKTSSSSGIGSNGGILNILNVAKGTIVGSDDTATFKDTVEGTLKEGGIEGEGAYHLERSGGESQNVYLTSSTVDLSKFINRKIKVWGQTQQAQTAGWLMDAGRIQML